mmetsp:Transcript_10078/g.22987  ORF Transcript_10078/g.22987 Transcript_10078/m.22987 type:complete len:287 (+) Transcript_10078:796-1656(+)
MERVVLLRSLCVSSDHVLPLSEWLVAQHAGDRSVGKYQTGSSTVKNASKKGRVALVSLAADGNFQVGVGELQQLHISELDRVDGNSIVVGLDCGCQVHLADDRLRIDSSQLDLRLVVGGEEGECSLPEHVVLCIILDPRVSQVEEERKRQLRAWHPRQLHRHLLWETEAQDTVDALEVWAVAGGDASKLGHRVEVAELHDVCRLVPLEVGVVRILEKKLPVLDVPDGLRLGRIEPRAVGTSRIGSPALVGVERTNELIASGIFLRVAILALATRMVHAQQGSERQQ